MKKLLNTLYITSFEKYLSLDGETVVVTENNIECARIPLHNLESIVTMGYAGVSPALLGKCAEYGIVISFLSRSGRFLAHSVGPYNGNVILRKTQYRYSDDEEKCTSISQNIITGKLFNSRSVIERAIRDYSASLDVSKLKKVSDDLKISMSSIEQCQNTEQLRGIEGEAASRYFSVFDDLILQQKKDFSFLTRVRRPPTDEVNAMLSFSYTLLNSMTTSALYCVGLDPYVGFMHKDRPGRTSLSLDLMEELRSVFADRFVLTMINKRIINKKDFFTKENGAVYFTDDGKKKFLQSWQSKKQNTIMHPFLKEKVEWGMVPYVQALLLARFLRGDIDGYPPFLWK
ncbi:MAG: type I-C CRISPR-associated endonuclease Cas1c [Ruminococcus sp.]|nr:type I-C CRISPR-associated endonuclease Cas1c [Ruminococcus sp.]